MKKYYKEIRGEKYPTHNLKMKANQTGHVLRRKLPCKMRY
jgi:hypothetical protein